MGSIGLSNDVGVISWMVDGVGFIRNWVFYNHKNDMWWQGLKYGGLLYQCVCGGLLQPPFHTLLQPPLLALTTTYWLNHISPTPFINLIFIIFPKLMAKIQIK